MANWRSMAAQPVSVLVLLLRAPRAHYPIFCIAGRNSAFDLVPEGT